MPDSGSYTNSNTFTRTDAQFLASRIAAELTQIQFGYAGNNPTTEMIVNYAVEAALLLHHKRLKKAQYGFKKNGEWVLVLEYTADYNGRITSSGTPGGVPTGANIEGASWYSYMTYHTTNHTAEELEEIESALPFRRSHHAAPGYAVGGTSDTKSFERSGVGLDRKAYWVR